MDPTKPFPREAEPRPDTLGDLAALVPRCGCDIGFAQDPDGDRLAVADETGRVLDNDDVLALAVDAALERVPGDVVVNLTTSSVIDDVAAAHGRRVYRTPVGEANVVETMQAVGAAIGGEGSNGGIIFPAVHLCRDSYTGMAFLLDRMAETGLKASELAARLPRYYRKLGKVAFEHGRLGIMMQTLEDSFPDAPRDRADGLKLFLPEGWIHVRSSNTEPILRLAAEAKSQQGLDELYGRVSALLEELRDAGKFLRVRRDLLLLVGDVDGRLALALVAQLAADLHLLLGAAVAQLTHALALVGELFLQVRVLLLHLADGLVLLLQTPNRLRNPQAEKQQNRQSEEPGYPAGTEYDWFHPHICL